MQDLSESTNGFNVDGSNAKQVNEFLAKCDDSGDAIVARTSNSTDETTTQLIESELIIEASSAQTNTPNTNALGSQRCEYLIINPNLMRDHCVVSPLSGGSIDQQTSKSSADNSIVLLDRPQGHSFIAANGTELDLGHWNRAGEIFPVIQLEHIGAPLIRSSADSTLLDRSLASSSNSSTGTGHTHNFELNRLPYGAAPPIKPTHFGPPQNAYHSATTNCHQTGELNSQGELTVTDESSSFITEHMNSSRALQRSTCGQCVTANGEQQVQLEPQVNSLTTGQPKLDFQVCLCPPNLMPNRYGSNSNNVRQSNEMQTPYSSTTSTSTISQSLGFEQVQLSTLRHSNNTNSSQPQQSKRADRVRFMDCNEFGQT